MILPEHLRLVLSRSILSVVFSLSLQSLVWACSLPLDELPEESHQEITKLTQSLIKAYPAYNSAGLTGAFDILTSYFVEKGWQTTRYTYFAKELKDHPLYVDVQAFGDPYTTYEDLPKENLIAILDSQKPGPTLILNGHVDVDIVDESRVWFQKEGWKSGVVQEGKLWGRGATDMLGGLCAVSHVASSFAEKHDWRGRIILCAVSDEEIGGNGTLSSLLWLKKNGHLKPSAYPVECIIAEPSENKPCQESLGFLHVQISLKRTPVHMGVAQEQNQTLFDLASILTMGPQLAHAVGGPENAHKIRFNIGKVQGGIDAAIPIGDLAIEGTLFYPDACTVSDVFTNFKKFLESRYPANVTKSSFGFDGASFSTAFQGALPQTYHLFPSPCDARLYKAFNVPTLVWGPGSLRQAHCVDEFLEVNELRSYADRFRAFLKSYLKP